MSLDQILCSCRCGDSMLQAEQPNPRLFPFASGDLITKIDPHKVKNCHLLYQETSTIFTLQTVKSEK